MQMPPAMPGSICCLNLFRVREGICTAVTEAETTPSFAARKRLDTLLSGRQRDRHSHAALASESEANYMCILLAAAYWGRLAASRVLSLT